LLNFFEFRGVLDLFLIVDVNDGVFKGLGVNKLCIFGGMNNHGLF
jgi:hypothetical protein